MSNEVKCACNACPLGPEDKVPPRIPFDYDSYCGIAVREGDGIFRSGFIIPTFSESGNYKYCKQYIAFQKWKQTNNAQTNAQT